MDIIMIGIFVTWGCIVLAFIGYAVTTHKIIKQQEQEIEKLHRDMDKQYDIGFADGRLGRVHRRSEK